MAGLIFTKASGLNDSFFGRSQEPIKMLLEKDVEAFSDMSLITKVFKTVDSKNFAEKFTYATSLGSFAPVGEGGAYPRSERQEGYSRVVEPEEWKNSFAITKTMVEDNKMLDISQAALGFTDAYNRTREIYAGSMLAGGLNATTSIFGKTFNTATADGVSLFSTAHTSKTGGTGVQSNRFSNAFSVDALSMAEVAMQSFTDDDGNILTVAPDTIIIPNEYSLKRDVFIAIGADKDPATANNGFNYQFGRWNVIISPYLGSSFKANKYWLLFDSRYNDTRGTLMWVNRVPLSVHSWIDENNDNNIFNGRARFAAGFNNWRGIAVGGVAGGTTLS